MASVKTTKSNQKLHSAQVLIPSVKQLNLVQRLSRERHKIVIWYAFPTFFQYLNSAGAKAVQPILYGEEINLPSSNINKYKVKENVSHTKIPPGTILNKNCTEVILKTIVIIHQDFQD